MSLHFSSPPSSRELSSLLVTFEEGSQPRKRSSATENHGQAQGSERCTDRSGSKSPAISDGWPQLSSFTRIIRTFNFWRPSCIYSLKARERAIERLLSTETEIHCGTQDPKFCAGNRCCRSRELSTKERTSYRSLFFGCHCLWVRSFNKVVK